MLLGERRKFRRGAGYPFQRVALLGSWPQPAGQSPILLVAAATPLPAREPRPLWVQRTRKWYGVFNAD